MDKILFKLLNTKPQIVNIITQEEQYCLELIQKYCQHEDSNFTETVIYSPGVGFNQPVNKELIGSDFLDKINNGVEANYFNYKILVLIDFQEMVKSLSVVNTIKNVIFNNDNSVVVFISRNLILPPELNSFSITYETEPLRNEEIEEVIKSLNYSSQNASFKQELLKNINLCYGMSRAEIINSIKYALATYANTREQINSFKSNRTRAISQNSRLDYIELTNSFEEIAGFNNLKEWVNNIDKFKNRPDLMPRGMLLVGITGCGKSLCVKATAKQLNIPLLKLDFGRILDKYVGESEENIRKALKVAEQLSPCVLWFDEFEKAIGSSKDSGSDNNISQRILGYILTWLQEHKSSVFTAATVNNISKLPSELLRRGRFDKIYFVDFPSLDEKDEIIRIHLRKLKLSGIQENDIRKLSKEMHEFSGADIEYVIKEAARHNYGSNRSLFEDIMTTIKATHSVKEMMSDEIGNMKGEFRGRHFEAV